MFHLKLTFLLSSSEKKWKVLWEVPIGLSSLKSESWKKWNKFYLFTQFKLWISQAKACNKEMTNFRTLIGLPMKNTIKKNTNTPDT